MDFYMYFKYIMRLTYIIKLIYIFDLNLVHQKKSISICVATNITFISIDNCTRFNVTLQSISHIYVDNLTRTYTLKVQ